MFRYDTSCFRHVFAATRFRPLSVIYRARNTFVRYSERRQTGSADVAVQRRRVVGDDRRRNTAIALDNIDIVKGRETVAETQSSLLFYSSQTISEITTVIRYDPIPYRCYCPSESDAILTLFRCRRVGRHIWSVKIAFRRNGFVRETLYVCRVQTMCVHATRAFQQYDDCVP